MNARHAAVRVAFAAAASVPLLAMAFAPSAVVPSVTRFAPITRTNLAVDPGVVVDVTNGVTNVLSGGAAAASGAFESSASLLSFADQGQNLAGIFFQASLLPYLGFLYFLGYKGNRTPALGNFGWQFLLLFVLSTIPGGIISKSVYGVSLADCDWLHGSAEALLTTVNILIVSCLRKDYFLPSWDGLEICAGQRTTRLVLFIAHASRIHSYLSLNHRSLASRVP